MNQCANEWKQNEGIKEFTIERVNEQLNERMDEINMNEKWRTKEVMYNLNYLYSLVTHLKKCKIVHISLSVLLKHRRRVCSVLKINPLFFQLANC